MNLVTELVSADVCVGMPLTYVVSTTTVFLWLDWVLKATGNLNHSSAGMIRWYHSVSETILALPSRLNPWFEKENTGYTVFPSSLEVRAVGEKRVASCVIWVTGNIVTLS